MIARGIWLFRWSATGFICARIGERDDWILGVVLLLIAVAFEVQAWQLGQISKSLRKSINATTSILEVVTAAKTRTGQEATSREGRGIDA